MFQTYTETARPEQAIPRLSALRAKLAAQKLDGFLIPRADRFMGEYVAPRDERLAWLTGFTGSAGFCAVLAQQAGIFVDGRYTVQVRAQVDTDLFTPLPWPATRVGHWLAQTAPKGGRIGFDPWLHSASELEKLTADSASADLEFVAVDNLIDAIWPDQPAPPCAPILPHPLEFSGQSAQDKITHLSQALKADAALITQPDSIAWLLNVRGSDIPRNPVPHAMAILHRSAEVDLFCDPAKITEDTRAHLPNCVTLHGEDGLHTALAAFSGQLQIDPATGPVALERSLGANASVHHAEDPCLMPKARKNPAELEGMRAAHARDAVAMVRFLAWLDAQTPGPNLTEIDIAKALEGFRREDNALRDISFDSIVGSGPHGAVVHYRVTEQTNRSLRAGELLLVDSGGQYLDGTTDITRTIPIGAPDQIGHLEKDCYTRVLQGVIAISRARWPEGLAGRDLDPLARFPLWTAGRDYDHGTGHGVGAFLSVHEGPQRISRVSHVALESGMILSNEPGYYKEGAFGIRLENLIVVTPAPEIDGQDARTMLSFETLTWVPFDRRMILKSALSPDEIAWIDAYHAEVAQRIGPRLEGAAAQWLAAATAPL